MKMNIIINISIAYKRSKSMQFLSFFNFKKNVKKKKNNDSASLASFAGSSISTTDKFTIPCGLKWLCGFRKMDSDQM